MFEAYKVGVRLSLVNHVSSGLMSIIHQFGATSHSATELQSKLKEIKLLGAVGGVMAAGGFMGLGLISKTIKPATEYAHQLVLMNSAGMKHLEIVEATKAAWAATKVAPTSSVSENMEAVRDLRMVFGDTDHATQFMPTLQKIQGVLSNMRHGMGGNSKAEAYELAKALEMKGAVKTPAQFEGQADAMTKALVSAGGKVRATDFLSAFKYGRAATTGWDDDFAYKILPTLIQEMKGGGGSATGGPGSALMSAYAAVVGGTVTQRSLKLWNKLGLLDKSKIEWTKVGEAKGVRPGGIIGNELFQANPYNWVQQHLVPAMTKAGMTTETQQKQTLQYLFPNRTAGFVMTQFATQAWKFERDRRLIAGARGLEGYDDMVKNDPAMAQIALHKQWNTLLAIIGFQIMPPFIKGLQSLISTIRIGSNFLKEHTTFAKSLVIGFTALSAAMAFGGTVILLTAAWKAMGLFMPVILSLSKTALPLLRGALIGKLGLVGAVAVASYAIGSMANDMINKFTKWATNGKNDTLGGWVYDATHGNKKDSVGWKGNTFIGVEKNPFWTPQSVSTVPQFITKHTVAQPMVRGVVNNHVNNSVMDSDVINSINKNRNDAMDDDVINSIRHSNVTPSPRVNAVKPRNSNKTVQVNSSINLDGRKVAAAITNHQVSEVERPNSGLSGMFDSSMSLAPVGY